MTFREQPMITYNENIYTYISKVKLTSSVYQLEQAWIKVPDTPTDFKNKILSNFQQASLFI